METYAWYNNFIDTLNKKYPRKVDLLQALIDLLHIEREAVYRRLRQDVLFSVHEMAKIVTAWNISLDAIMGTNASQVPFQMRRMNYIDPSADELKYLRFVLQSILVISKYPDTEFMDICNKLPRQIASGYEYLNRFYLFKWLYQYGNEKEIIPYAGTIVSNEVTRLRIEYYEAIKQVPASNFILDRNLFQILVSDIRYFHTIHLITDEEKALIKKDLQVLLDYTLEVANKGCYPETKNKVNLFISELNVDSNYSYAFSREADICFIHVFEKFDIYTLDKEMAANFKKWMQLKKRSSFQISIVDERGRIEYFARQRQIVDEL